MKQRPLDLARDFEKETRPQEPPETCILAKNEGVGLVCRQHLAAAHASTAGVLDTISLALTALRKNGLSQ